MHPAQIIYYHQTNMLNQHSYFIHLFNIFTKNQSYVNLIIVGLSTMLTSSHTFSRKLDERRQIAMIDKIIMLLLATSITIVALKLLIQS